jgi:hypothetical protein
MKAKQTLIMKDQFFPADDSVGVDDREARVTIAVAAAIMVCFALATIFGFGTESPAPTAAAAPLEITVAHDATNGPRHHINSSVAVIVPASASQQANF